MYPCHVVNCLLCDIVLKKAGEIEKRANKRWIDMKANKFNMFFYCCMTQNLNSMRFTL